MMALALGVEKSLFDLGFVYPYLFVALPAALLLVMSPGGGRGRHKGKMACLWAMAPSHLV
jgi:hypothetical protein